LTSGQTNQTLSIAGVPLTTPAVVYDGTSFAIVTVRIATMAPELDVIWIRGDAPNALPDVPLVIPTTSMSTPQHPAAIAVGTNELIVVWGEMTGLALGMAHVQGTTINTYSGGTGANPAIGQAIGPSGPVAVVAAAQPPNGVVITEYPLTSFPSLAMPVSIPDTGVTPHVALSVGAGGEYGIAWVDRPLVCEMMRFEVRQVGDTSIATSLMMGPVSGTDPQPTVVFLGASSNYRILVTQ
jgi:hypothetical protein